MMNDIEAAFNNSAVTADPLAFTEANLPVAAICDVFFAEAARRGGRSFEEKVVEGVPTEGQAVSGDALAKLRIGLL